MQQDILTAVPSGKVYKINHIILAGLFGGMFASAFLLAGNFKTFGKKEKVFSTWVYAALLFLALTGTAFIPALDSIPNLVYSVVITIIIAAFASKQQKADIEQHIEHQGEVHSGGRVVIVTIIGFLLMAAIAIGAFMMADRYVSDVPNSY